MKKIFFLVFMGTSVLGMAQKKPLSIENLWELKRVSSVGLTADKQKLIYKVTLPNVAENLFETKYYGVELSSGKKEEISKEMAEEVQKKYSSDKKWELFHKSVKVKKALAPDFYSDLDKSSGKLFSNLDYRHWDKFMEGDFNHIFLKNNDNGQEIDIMEGLPYYSPQEPFGGSEDYIWSPKNDKIYYVTKAKTGTDYVNSTNTDIFEYHLQTKQTKNISEGMLGYDTHPAFNPSGTILAWLSMKTDGNEADKNDLILLENGVKRNVTEHWDNTILEYRWNESGKSIFIIAATDGTLQLFELFPFQKKIEIKQITNGMFDVRSVVGQKGNHLYVERTSMNEAPEIFSFNLKTKVFENISKENEAFYENIAQCRTEKRYVETTDGKKMVVWVVYPPNFDSTKKYPALLYCQGGPQSALTQMYSFRWNFQLMASQGYVVIAPNRRGMPGFGVEWNAQISKDWGGQVMQDYLSATDAIAKESFIDKNRIGAVGASYGGYSVYYLAGIHQNRFKSFIAHCGVFDLRSMYGTTDEKFFNTNEMGGAYWENSPEVKKSYEQFNPINFVNNWNTPILIIHGGKDYRVPKEQGFQAFTAAQQKGIKSELLFFPDENHWVLQPQNGIFWQRNFYRWLQETLK